MVGDVRAVCCTSQNLAMHFKVMLRAAKHLLGLTHSADFHPLMVVFSPRQGQKTTIKKDKVP
jgi:hypothetical protein